jgi:hypothetical protein
LRIFGNISGIFGSFWSCGKVAEFDHLGSTGKTRFLENFQGYLRVLTKFYGIFGLLRMLTEYIVVSGFFQNITIFRIIPKTENFKEFLRFFED